MAQNIAVDVQNGRKRFIQTISLTSTPSLTTIAAVTQDGVAVGSGSTICFQPDTDVIMLLRPTSVVATQPITVTNSLRVPAGAQEYQKLSQNPSLAAFDGKIEAASVSGTSNLQLFLVDPS